MGVASAAFSLTRTAGFVPFGALADRVGPRIPCTLLFMVACLGNLYYYAAKRPADVVAARAIVGVGSSVTGILMAVVAAGDAASPEARARRDRNLTLFNGTSLLALLLGPGLAAMFAYADRVEMMSIGPGFAPSFKKTARAFRRRKNQPGRVSSPRVRRSQVRADAARVRGARVVRVRPVRRAGLILGVPDGLLRALVLRLPAARAARSPRGYFSDESRRRRGRDADIPRRRVAAAPRISQRRPGARLRYSGAAASDDAVAPPPKPFARHHARAALVGRRGATSLVVEFVGGSFIATLDTAFPIVAKDDFGATMTTISVVMALFAIAGVLAMIVSGAYMKLGGPDERAAERKVHILRVCVLLEISGGLLGLGVYRGLPKVELAAVGMCVGALCMLGALGGSNANLQLLAGVADMRRHPGFYSGLRSVALCAGRATSGLLTGFLLDLDPSPTHTSMFASVTGFAALSLVPVFFFPPRVVAAPRGTPRTFKIARVPLNILPKLCSRPRRRRDSSPRHIHVAAAAESRARPTRPTDASSRVPPPRTAVSPRLVRTDRAVGSRADPARNDRPGRPRGAAPVVAVRRGVRTAVAGDGPLR